MSVSFLPWQQSKLASVAWGRASEPLFKRLYICAHADSELTSPVALASIRNCFIEDKAITYAQEHGKESSEITG